MSFLRGTSVLLLRTRALKVLVCAFLVGAAVLAIVPALADESADNGFYDGKLHFGLTPYLWLPTLNGTFRYSVTDIHGFQPPPGAVVARTFDTRIRPNAYLTNLNFALMASGQIRKGNFAIVSDIINATLSNQTSSIVNLTGPRDNLTFPVSVSAQSRAVATLWTIAPSFTVMHSGDTSVDVLVGGRFFWLTASSDWQLSGPFGVIAPQGSVSKSASYEDVVVGSYGQLGFAKHWAIPYYIDVGTGTPSFTWQALLGVKYGQLSLAYRHLDYQSGSGLLQNMTLSGPILGYTFRF